MNKTLITAFEPYGASGTLRNENASLSIVRRLQQVLSRQDYEYLVLPTSVNASHILASYAKLTSPRAIFSMGEDFIQIPNAVRIEPYAHDCDSTSNPIAGLLVPRIDSAFARSAYPEMKNSTLLAYHCNAVFRAGLKWAERNGEVPVAFAHVAVIGNRDTQTQKTLTILNQLEAMAARP